MTTSEREVILRIDHITKRFPLEGGKVLTACDDVTFPVYRGEILGIVGESGCGKSTLVRTLMQLHPPSEGQIFFKDQEITGLKGEDARNMRRNIQMVFQDPTTSFNPKMKIKDIICEPLRNFGLLEGSARDKAAEPLRLIFEPCNPADERISAYLDTHGYDLEDPNLDAEKMSHFLRLIVSMVMTVGGIISVLSFYVLLLSIYLLVEKNASKLKTLLLLGYSPARVALPYQLLSVGLNLTVLLLSLLILLLVRTRYIHLLETLFPDLPQGSAAPAILVGLALFLLVTVMNATIIRRKIVRSRGVF